MGTSKLIVYTGRLNAFAPGKIDITIKSASTLRGKAFAPDNWDMVMGVKNGTVSWEAYTKWYKALVYRRWLKDPTPFMDVLKMGKVTLCCYCNDPEGHKRCHRFLAVAALTWMAQQVGVEVTYLGEAESVPE